MTAQPLSKAMHIGLWSAQGLLAALLLSGAIMKFMPIDKLSAMMPWTGQVPAMVVRLLGVIDLAGALGLLLPGLLNIKPRLTVWAALGTIVLMLCAIVFHLLRGEGEVTGMNVVAVLIAAWIARGRSRSVPKV